MTINVEFFKKRVQELHQNLGIIIKKDELIGNKDETTILMTLEKDLDGEIDIRAPISEHSNKELLSSLRNAKIGKDKFLVVCKGNYSFPSKSVSLYCGIKNEDGIPVSMLNIDEELKKKVTSLSDRLLGAFYEQ